MADKNIALEYFESYLPPFVTGQLDFSTLTQLPDVYVSAELQKTMSDIVYSCERKDRKGKIKVSLLIEHKSYPDKYTPVQIGSYIFSGLQKQIENDKNISLIIPVLLYHGKDKWEYYSLTNLFKNLEPEWKQFIPDFDYIYTNLNEVSDEHIEALNNKFLAASFLALKHSFQKDWLEANIVRILLLSENVPANLLRNLIVYLFERSELGKEKIEELIEKIPITIKNTVMSTVNYLMKEGEKIGMTKKEYEKNRAFTQSLIRETVFDDAKIAKLVGVTVDFVASVRVELNPGI
ncbi:transposase [Dyadobacter frigoris]|nr:transposase [Dyadobacter frigoris]